MAEEPDSIQKEFANRLLKKVARGGGIAFVGRVLKKGLGFVLQITLGRFLGPAAYGLYSLGTNLLNLAGKISLLGLQNGLIRFVSLHRGEDDKRKLTGVIRLSLGAGVLFSSAVGFVLFIFSGYISEGIFGEPGLVKLVQVFALFLPVSVLVALLKSTLRGFQNMRHFVFVQLARAGGNILFILGSFLLGFRLYGAVGGFLISMSAAALFGVYLLYLNSPEFFQNTKTIIQPKKLFRFSFPMYLAGFSYLIMSRTDIFMLGFFMNSDDVGIYRAAVSIAVLANFALVAFNQAFAPMLSDLFNKDRLEEIQKLYTTVTRWGFVLSSELVLLMILFSTELLGVFGEEFKAGWKALIILAVFQLVAVSVGSVDILLQMSGNQDYVLINNVATAVLNVGLNFWLIPIFGIVGGGLATGISIAFNNLAGLVEVYILKGLQPWDISFLKLSVIVLASGSFYPIFYVFNLPWYVGIFLIGGLFVLLLYLFGLTEEEIVIIRAVKRKMDTN